MPTKLTDVAWLSPDLYPDVAPGQYRTIPKSGNPLDGDLVQWVDDKPDDPSDGTGHFAVFTGKPADYTYSKAKP